MTGLSVSHKLNCWIPPFVFCLYLLGSELIFGVQLSKMGLCVHVCVCVCLSTAFATRGL